MKEEPLGRKGLTGPICSSLFLNPNSLLDGLKLTPFVILFVKRESALGGKGLTGPICSSLSLNSFPPRPAKTGPLCCFTLSNTRSRQFYSSRETLGGKGLHIIINLHLWDQHIHNIFSSFSLSNYL